MCPDLAGEFRTNDRVIYANLIARFLAREQRDIDWYSATLRYTDGDSLEIVVAQHERRDTVRVSILTHFQCVDGWLTGEWPSQLVYPTPTDDFDLERGYERTLFLSRDRGGRLIGREEIVSYREFAVWCGDGCKYVRIPGTRRRSVRWHRMSTPRTADTDNNEPMFDAAANARMARDEAALERGEPLPRATPRR